MEVPSIPELTNEQIEALSDAAEEAARSYIFSKVPLRMIENLNISVEAEGTKPLNLSVEINIKLSKGSKDCDIQQLANDAAKEDLKASESSLRNLK